MEAIVAELRERFDLAWDGAYNAPLKGSMAGPQADPPSRTGAGFRSHSVQAWDWDSASPR